MLLCGYKAPSEAGTVSSGLIAPLSTLSSRCVVMHCLAEVFVVGLLFSSVSAAPLTGCSAMSKVYNDLFGLGTKDMPLFPFGPKKGELLGGRVTTASSCCTVPSVHFEGLCTLPKVSVPSVV